MIIRYLICISTIFVLGDTRKILSLDLENYAETKSTYRPLIVLFIKEDRLGKKFKQDYLKLSEDEGTLDDNITLAIVDADVETKLVEKTQIIQFPTAYLFMGDAEKYKYQGYWIMDNFLNWIRKSYRSSPYNSKLKFIVFYSKKGKYAPAGRIDSFQQLQLKLDMFKIVSILFIHEEKVDILMNYQTMANKFPDFYFAYIHDWELAKPFNITEESLIIHTTVEDRDTYIKSNDYNDYIVKYEGDLRDQHEIMIFLKIHNKKRFYFVDYHKYGQLVKRKDNFITFFFVYNSTVPGETEFALSLKQLKRWSFRKAYIGVIDVKEDASSRARHDFWFKYPEDVPSLVAVKSKGDGEYYWKYKCPQTPMNIDSIKLCYEDIILDKIPNFIRNQDIPEDQIITKKGVRNLNSTTYWNYIGDQNELGKDVIMMIHMDGCKTCEAFQETYDEIIDDINEKNKDQVTFAQIDWQLNELENTGVDKFPFIIVYGASGRKSSLNQLKPGEKWPVISFIYKSCYNQLEGLIEKNDL